MTTAQNARSLSPAKQALLEQRLKAGPRDCPAMCEIPKRPDSGCAPLSYPQRQMWAMDQMTPGNPAFNLPFGYRLQGRLNKVVLEASFNAVIERHELLRTTFDVDNGEPIQRIHRQFRIAIRIADLRQVPDGEREARLQALASEESVRPFDLRSLPLIRASLFTLADAEHVLVINLHHIIADGMSAALLMNEVGALYSALAAGSAARLPDLSVQYGDFALWQQQRTAKEAVRAGQIAFWTRRLGGTLPKLNLPIDNRRLVRKSYRGADVFFDIPAELGGDLKSLAARERCTLFMTLLAAFQALLRRYTGADDLIVVTPLASRTASELQPLIGNFLNLVPLRCDVAGDPTFVEVLRRTRDTTLDAFSNGDVPLETILETVQFEGASDGTPMFQVMLQMLPAACPTLGELAVSNFRFDLGFAQLDLSLHFYEEADGSYRGRFEYCTDLFRDDTVQALAANFKSLLDAMVENPSQRIARVPLAVPETRREPRAAEAIEEPQVPCEAPRTQNEKIVMAAFCNVLKRTNFGVFHNFFHLGGHSLAAARLMFQLRRESGLDLPLSILLERPTVERLAEAMDMLSWAASTRPVPDAAIGARVEIEL